jgi:hypothetical protein
MSRKDDILAKMPRLTAEQCEAVKDLLDYHISALVQDYPRLDDALYDVQRELETLVDPREGIPDESP